MTKLLKGAHGTALRYARLIEANGFKCGRRHRHGAGIYFYSSVTYNFIDLAAFWFRYDKPNRIKTKELREDDTAGVVIAQITVEEEQYIDLDDDDLRILLNKLFEQRGIQHKKHLMGDTIDTFVKRMGYKRGVEIKVIRKRISLPPKMCKRNEYDSEIFGNPVCLIVKDPDIISIISIEEY